MTADHIAFVGLMGSGKSTVGALVARRLQMPFFDLDALVVERFGSIESIFAREGEPGFRACEQAVLREVIALPPAIISTGGGIVTNEANRLLLAEMTTVYLDVPLEPLVRRLQRSATVRPLIGKNPNLERVQELFDAREPFYRRATYHVDANREVRSIVAHVVRLLKNHAKQSPR